MISKPAFWEGRCQARGTLGGRPVAGPAYIERSGFENISTLDEFFSAVGVEVRRSTAQALPYEPTHEELRDLIANEELAHYMDGVDATQMVETLIRPIREMVDRGGKSWRSYAALACCDVVGGDSRKFSQWLAMPELMHVGSLIIDDVQDQSTVRRGGPTCHVVHGEPIAINAGTAAYFLTQHQLQSDHLSADQKLRIYDLYFAAMRAGHAGQAIDLGGMASLMPDVVATGESAALEARILACHRLKTAAPAGCLARMGAVAGGGTDEQIAAVGEFFEAVGLAFQIMDDVLNLRGFKGNLKQRGEDIANGDGHAADRGRDEAAAARQARVAVEDAPGQAEGRADDRRGRRARADLRRDRRLRGPRARARRGRLDQGGSPARAVADAADAARVRLVRPRAPVLRERCARLRRGS